MFERLRALYLAEQLTREQLTLAVTKGWITAEQEAAIRAASGEQPQED